MSVKLQIPHFKRHRQAGITPEACCQDGEASGIDDILGTVKRAETIWPGKGECEHSYQITTGLS